MAIRKIIKIDEEKCNGCGLCVTACHEGAIKLVNGKAKLIRDDYCDGLGDCLPACNMGAITFEVREALDYNEEAVKRNLNTSCSNDNSLISESELSQWPVQIKLVPINATFFQDCDLLIAADCTAFAYANIHSDFIKNHITLIGCPKLDNTDYSEKLTQIFINNNIKSITILRMEVPCCRGIEVMVNKAIKSCGKYINHKVVVISKNGIII